MAMTDVTPTDASTALHVVLGAGPVGVTLASHLAGQGRQVRLVSRRGLGPTLPGVSLVRADASSAAALRHATAGAAVIYNALNPPYHRWPAEWPTLHRHVLDAATAHGATLVLVDNLYAYGDVDGAPLTSTLPHAATFSKGRVRAHMAASLLAAGRTGDLRVVIVRASDFFGPHVRASSFGERTVPGVLAGRSVGVIGSADVPHSLTYVPDVARTAITLAADPRAWGRIWHVPSPPPLTQREAIQALARVAGTMPARGFVTVRPLPHVLLRALGLFSAPMRELLEVEYQFTKPFVIDATDTEATFGLHATPFDEALAATVEWYRHAASVTHPGPAPAAA